MKKNYPTGCEKSPLDVRTFTSSPITTYIQKGGKRYLSKDIESQKKVGICTAIHFTQNACKATNIPFNADFQYLLQKIYYDSSLPIGWKEGSSIFSAVRIGKNYGLLPEKYWTHTTLEDRNLPYHEYIAKLRAIPMEEIERLIKIANKYKIKAYAKEKVTRDSMAQAIDESKAGILARFVIDNQWWNEPIEPLRRAKQAISGHAVTISNFDGGSFRIANTWGKFWADKGTAYYLLHDYMPTECWQVWYWDEEIPKEIEKKLESRRSIVGKILNLLQQIIILVVKLK